MSVYITSVDFPMARDLELSGTRGTVTTQPGLAPSTEGAGGAGGISEAVPFASVLESIVGEANESLNVADAATTSFARGEQHDLHGTMLALSQANIRLQLVNETRNHLLDAYREVMRMNV